MAVAAVAMALVGGVLVLVAGLVRTLVALVGERPDADALGLREGRR